MSETVSVVIPVFNTARFIAEALASVFAQAGEGLLLEVIVVDDGSTDASASLARDFSPLVTVVETAHAGIGAARNEGVRHAHGEFLAFLDADDLWTAGKLQAQVAALLKAGAPAFVTGMVEQFRHEPDGTRTQVGEIAKGYIAGAMLMRRETFERVGPFATGIRAGEFIDWYARATELGLRCEVLEQTVLMRRLHDANTARTSGSANQDVPSVLRAALQRRRAAAREI